MGFEIVVEEVVGMVVVVELPEGMDMVVGFVEVVDLGMVDFSHMAELGHVDWFVDKL